jgi:hypothetical protein
LAKIGQLMAKGTSQNDGSEAAEAISQENRIGLR